MFMLLVQLAGYLVLIEFGMAGAAARLLIDHKDRPDTGSYGSLIITGSVVFTVQALAIVLLGYAGATYIVRAIGVPPELAESAAYLLRWLCACFAFTTVFKMLGAALYAHKRLDVIGYLSVLNLLVGLGTMAIVLALGGGLTGLVIVFATQALLTVSCQAIACVKLHLLPNRRSWGRPTATRFKEMFSFAKDIFLINLSNQLLEASQLIIITRTMGLAAAAMWSVGTKIFNLIFQLLTRIEGTAIVFFSEMMVRGEHERLKIRFRQVYQLSAGFAVASLAVAIAINAPFVSLWAEPSLAWSMPLSAAMALAVFLSVVTRCHVDLILHTKKVFGLRYIYLLEAMTFVGLAFFLAPIIGFYGIVLSAICCLLLIRFVYTTWRVASYFHVQVRTVGLIWLKRPLLASLVLGPFVLCSPWVIDKFSTPSLQLVAAALWTTVPAAGILAFLALPPDSSGEIRAMIGKRATSLITAFRALF